MKRRRPAVETAVRPFEELRSEELELAGGKGAALARLYRERFPVPPGIVILHSAFVGDAIDTGAWAAVLAYVRGVWDEDPSAEFAVRSSALTEDSARASFAGQFETVLSVGSEEELADAILLVRQSRDSDRVRAYSLAKGLEAAHAMAVVVQRMIPAELSGVLFTAEPLTGSREVMTGAFVRGLGDRLVSGEATGEAFSMGRRGRGYSGPKALAALAPELARLGEKLGKSMGQPQDIEFAVADGRLFLLQSRPITTLLAQDPATGEWNDSRTGDFLWSNVNFGEAVSAPMTPLTWTVIRLVLADWTFLPGYESVGNLGGRPYLNLSVFASVFHAMGKSTRDLLEMLEPTVYTPLPEGMEIPLIALPRGVALRQGPRWARIEMRQRRGVRALRRYVASNRSRCRRLRARMRNAETASELASLWRRRILPHVERGVWIVLGSAAHLARLASPLRRDLVDLVGPEDADALLLGPSERKGELEVQEPPENLGPLLGIAGLATGAMSKDDYLDRYGHRGPDEFELSTPRPIEDPRWLDVQVELHRRSPIDLAAMLQRRRLRFAAAWRRLDSREPRRAGALRRRIAQASLWSRRREAARSEYVRDRWLVRMFALRAAELTGLDDDVFFLTIEELLGVLGGETVDSGRLAARRETHRRYRSLPPYPSVIRGRFDPYRWADDPQRRSDFFDASGRSAPAPLGIAGTSPLRGAAGSAGRAEGSVRLLAGPSEADRLRAGEVLVATQTDIEWTPLFPVAAAIVTDVGAPFSHAAIVARELGIPAVVGCGDATMRLRTGDRVIVDGGRGEVRLISRRRDRAAPSAAAGRA